MIMSDLIYIMTLDGVEMMDAYIIDVFTNATNIVFC